MDNCHLCHCRVGATTTKQCFVVFAGSSNNKNGRSNKRRVSCQEHAGAFVMGRGVVCTCCYGSNHVKNDEMELFMLQYNVHVAVASRRDEKKMLAFIVLPSHDTLATEQARNDKK